MGALSLTFQGGTGVDNDPVTLLEQVSRTYGGMAEVPILAGSWPVPATCRPAGGVVFFEGFTAKPTLSAGRTASVFGLEL